MTMTEVGDQLLADQHLQIIGVVTSDPRIALIGPLEPGFWPHFTASPEWQDGAPHPMDRWSGRVLTDIAAQVGAKARFPFGPSPAPFLTWAMDSDRAWQSPVGMVVHADAGLMVSFRGALVFDAPLKTRPAPQPCTHCTAPCLTACPVGALTGDGYDVAACKAWIGTEAGAECLQNGCRARRACPVSQSYGRDPRQSGYHMGQFLASE